MGVFDFVGDAYGALAGQTDPKAGQEAQRQARGQQQGANRTLEQWAMHGSGPSSAQALLERNRAENAAQQVGMAKTMGGDPALANRMAAEGIGRGASEATYQGALIRNQEQQQAMQNYLGNLNAMRGQDISVYGTEAQTRQGNAANQQQFLGNLINKGASAIGGFF